MKKLGALMIPALVLWAASGVRSDVTIRYQTEFKPAAALQPLMHDSIGVESVMSVSCFPLIARPAPASVKQPLYSQPNELTFVCCVVGVESVVAMPAHVCGTAGPGPFWIGLQPGNAESSPNTASSIRCSASIEG